MCFGMCVFQSTCTRCVKKCSDKEAAKTAKRKREGAIRERRNSELLNGVSGCVHSHLYAGP